MVRYMTIQAALLTALLLGGAFSPRPASAQSPHDMSEAAQVDMLLGAVMNRWQQSWEMNRRTDNAEVRSLLTHARSLLDEARAARQRGDLVRARLMAESASGLIERADQLMRLRDQQGTPQQVEQALREANDVLGRLRQQGPMGPRGMQVEKLIQQARQAALEGHPEVALRLSLMAQEESRRAWHEAMQSQMMIQRSAVLETMVEPLVERASRLAQARNDEQMSRVASHAQEHLRMARQLDVKTQAGPKARLLESAMREAELVLRTLDEAGYAQHRAARVIAEAQAALDRAAEVANDQDDADMTALLAQGRSALAQANEKLNAGDTQAAETLGEQARRTAQKIIRDALGPLTEDRVKEAIARTDQVLAQAAGVSNEDARAILANALARQAEARQLLAEGNLRRALAQTRVAARLAQRAYDLDQKQ